MIIGSSVGIGRAVATTMSARGQSVTELSRKKNGFDVTDPVSVDSGLGGLEGVFDLILVASGILAPPGAGPEKSLEQIDAAAMARVMAVCAIGPALILRHANRLLPARGRCVVAVLTARVGSIGDNRLVGWYAYRSSQAAANQIVHTAAIEIDLKRREVVVVALHPGTVATPFPEAYPGHRKVPAQAAAQSLLSVLDGFAPAQSGGFFDWAGAEVPW